MAYDNLVLHARFEQQMRPVDICEELRVLDGAMFPAFLPGLDAAGTFVFYDTLGFHAAGMVLDREPEPKAAIAVLARALNPKDEGPAAPTVGKQSAEMLVAEVLKHLQCHDVSNLLLVHALRPGDGLTAVRALGRVYEALADSIPGNPKKSKMTVTGKPGPGFLRLSLSCIRRRPSAALPAGLSRRSVRSGAAGPAQSRRRTAG